jgi:hypothetical protein
VVPEFGDQSIRELFLGSHRMIYQVTTHGVFIIGLVHGDRDLSAMWLREKRTGDEVADGSVSLLDADEVHAEAARLLRARADRRSPFWPQDRTKP